MKKETRTFVALALAGSLLAFNGWARASETEGSTEAGVSAHQPAPGPGGLTGGQDPAREARQRRKALLNARRQARREARGQATAQNQAAASFPAVPLTDIKVSFKVDPRLTRSLYMGDRWVSPPTYVGTNGQDTVEARAKGVDVKGVTMQVTPKWIPSDPEMVTVASSEGNEVKITVKRAGESHLRLAIENGSGEVILFKELLIKAWSQGGAIQVEIDTTRAAVRESARQEQSRPVVRNGWRFVD